MQFNLRLAVGVCACALLVCAGRASAAMIMTSQSRSSVSTAHEPAPYGTNGSSQSDSTKDAADIFSTSGDAEPHASVTARSELDSTFSAGNTFTINFHQAFIHLHTDASGSESPLDAATTITMDAFYNITDTANRYNWAYHGQIGVSSTTGSPPPDTFVSVNFNGDFNYSKTFIFSNSGTINDVNLSGSLPVGIGTYHFKLIGSLSDDLANTASGDAQTLLNLSGGQLTFSAVAVPEPACLAGLFAFGLCQRRQRRPHTVPQDDSREARN